MDLDDRTPLVLAAEAKQEEAIHRSWPTGGFLVGNEGMRAPCNPEKVCIGPSFPHSLLRTKGPNAGSQSHGPKS